MPEGIQAQWDYAEWLAYIEPFTVSPEYRTPEAWERFVMALLMLPNRREIGWPEDTEKWIRIAQFETVHGDIERLWDWALERDARDTMNARYAEYALPGGAYGEWRGTDLGTADWGHPLHRDDDLEESL